MIVKTRKCDGLNCTAELPRSDDDPKLEASNKFVIEHEKCKTISFEVTIVENNEILKPIKSNIKQKYKTMILCKACLLKYLTDANCKQVR